ncbi:regulator of telomere elongation helicase [Striga asiatica]|uniref:Regulator of telomere elongation helicase 1 homolog n=1 Tax=Striga asiatica TaxID=4170 RepID=A0A5A7QGZ3_STRAF|nr:regulator of telomere elongation helicase [Striga asiatica]
MPTYKIRGIDVDFPYEAYDCQLVYMEKVIQSLQNRCNALLESPTGTGKTLCLLCATLAWRKSLGDFTRGLSERNSVRGSQHLDADLQQSQSSKFPTIIYASRTHSQIRQVVQELKRSHYRPKMVVLGSREQLCIHDHVSLLRGKAQTNACRALCKRRTKRYCSHFSQVAEFVKKNPRIGDDPIDIEDLVNIGKSCGACPYYLSREIHKDVDILFAPYNYLIDRGNRKSLKIDWDRSILIFDEAHNLESICADAASFDLPSGLLTACISEAKKCVDLSVTRRETSSDKSCNPDNFAILRALLLKLEKRIAEVPLESKELGFTKPGPYIYELLSELNITQTTANMLTDIIEKACVLLEEDVNVSESGGSHKTSGTICRLENMGDILRLIFRDDSNAHAQYYRVHVQEVEASAADDFRGKTSRTLSWWCFNPGIAMEEFSKLGIGSIILTSGTLSPMDSFAEELKLDFPIRSENPHVISDNQIYAGIAPVGPSGYAFNSSYRSRGSIEYKLELGNAIVNFARIVPDGLLVFFPSYYLLDQCISCWKSTGQKDLSTSSTIWERICKHKLPVVEPRQSSLFPLAIEDYMTKLKDTCSSGAIFFAVCRGKVSEGLDFADHAGRAVIVTGLPFATMTDAKVRLKREFLDQQVQSLRTGVKGLTGEEWYTQQASRAVNQAVGRVIRHQHDYGAIIFCDERFTNSSRQSQISMWIKPHVKCYSKFGDVVYTLTRFFREAGTRCPPKLDLAQDAVVSGPQKLELTQNEYQENASFDSSPSTEQLKREKNISSRLKEVLPANRSYLTSHKILPDSLLSLFKSPDSNNTSHTLKDPLISGKRNGEETKDMSGSCILGKHRLLITGPDKPSNNLSNLVKKKKLQLPENLSTSKPGGKELLLASDEVIVSKKTFNHNEETKGSAFLTKVREKLTGAEYEKFVGFMKALKSNSMKISDVLQSITRLFSAPDRLALLHGFKDYVPAKYRSLYEHFLCANGNAAGFQKHIEGTFDGP